MRIHKTIIFTNDGSGDVLSCDTIEYEGAFWLVPEWLKSHDGRSQIPARIIRISDHSQFQRPDEAEGSDFLLNEPVPRDVFDGVRPRKGDGGFVVIEGPNIEFGSPVGFH